MRHLIPVDVNVTEKSPYFRGVSRRLMTVSLAAVFLSACAATDQEVGMVLGSTAAGAAIGALGGAALDPTDRNRGATSGALGGAAIGAAVGYANVAQRRQDQYQRSNSYYYNPPPHLPGIIAGKGAWSRNSPMAMVASPPRRPAPPKVRRRATATTDHPLAHATQGSA